MTMWTDNQRRSAAAVALVFFFAACAGAAARHEVLIPALARAWPGVRDDAIRGAERVAQPDAAREAVRLAGDAVAAADGARLLAVWPTVRESATAGIARREADGDVGPIGVGRLRERLAQFGRAVDALAAAPTEVSR